MATIIEVSESKLDCLSECTEKILKHGGKLMRLLEELSEGGMYGARGGSGSGGGMSGVRSYGWDEDRDYDEREKRYGKNKSSYGYNRYY